jgi:hypothetical protein
MVNVSLKSKQIGKSMLGLTLLFLSGCSTKFEVKSTTLWSGFVNGASVSGYGSATYSAKPGDACAFQKATNAGTLAVRAKGWHGDGNWKSTSAPYGVVTAVASR